MANRLSDSLRDYDDLKRFKERGPRCPDHGQQRIERDPTRFQWRCRMQIIKASPVSMVASSEMTEPQISFEAGECDFRVTDEDWYQMQQNGGIVGRGQQVDYTDDYLSDILKMQDEIAMEGRVPNILMAGPELRNKMRMDDRNYTNIFNQHSGANVERFFGMNVVLNPAIPAGQAYLINGDYVNQPSTTNVPRSGHIHSSSYNPPAAAQTNAPAMPKTKPKTAVEVLRASVEEIQQMGRKAFDEQGRSEWAL